LPTRARCHPAYLTFSHYLSVLLPPPTTPSCWPACPTTLLSHHLRILPRCALPASILPTYAFCGQTRVCLFSLISRSPTAFLAPYRALRGPSLSGGWYNQPLDDDGDVGRFVSPDDAYLGDGCVGVTNKVPCAGGVVVPYGDSARQTPCGGVSRRGGSGGVHAEAGQRCSTSARSAGRHISGYAS